MLLLIKLAWKNVWRNKRRSAVMIAAIALGLWAGLFASGFMKGMMDTMVRSAIDRDLTHIQIHAKEYLATRSSALIIENGDSIIQHLRSFPTIKGVSGRMIVDAMVSSARKMSGVRLTAVVPDDEALCTIIHERLVDGEYFRTSGKDMPVVVGNKLAEKLNVGLNSKVVLTFQSVDGTLVSTAAKVVGIYQTESSVFDGMTVFAIQRDVAALYGKNVIHEIVTRLQNHTDLDDVASTLKETYKEYDVQTWKELSPDSKLIAESSRLYANIFLGIILFALLFGITNTMLMAVHDRIREFGMLIAIGMQRYALFGLLITETVLLSFAGGCAGMLLGYTTLHITGYTGIDMRVFSEGLLLYGISPVVYPVLELSTYGVLTIMIFFTAIIAAIYPAIKVLKLQPVEAVRVI